ncbi:MAG: hypothetical protein ACOYBQ_08475 [Fluviibacter sp.]
MAQMGKRLRQMKTFEEWLKGITPEQLAVANQLAGSPRAMYDRIREVMERPK